MSHKGLYSFTYTTGLVISDGRKVSNYVRETVKDTVRQFHKETWTFTDVNWAEEFKLPLEFVLN